MDNMNITAAHYITDLEGSNAAIQATIDGADWTVPIDKANQHYVEILRQVKAKKLIIKDAEPVVLADEPAEDLPTIADLQKQIKKLEAAMKRKK
jgi:hypothetical protein